MSRDAALPLMAAIGLVAATLLIVPLFAALYRDLGTALPDATRAFLGLRGSLTLLPGAVLALVAAGRAVHGRYRHLALAAAHGINALYLLFALVALAAPLFRLGDAV